MPLEQLLFQALQLGVAKRIERLLTDEIVPQEGQRSCLEARSGPQRELIDDSSTRQVLSRPPMASGLGNQEPLRKQEIGRERISGRFERVVFRGRRFGPGQHGFVVEAHLVFHSCVAELVRACKALYAKLAPCSHDDSGNGAGQVSAEQTVERFEDQRNFLAHNRPEHVDAARLSL